jgi:YD repeat-containing protein
MRRVLFRWGNNGANTCHSSSLKSLEYFFYSNHIRITTECQMVSIVENGGPRIKVQYTDQGNATQVQTINQEGTIAHTVAFSYDGEGRASNVIFDGDNAQQYTISYEVRPRLFDARKGLFDKTPLYAAVVTGPGTDKVSFPNVSSRDPFITEITDSKQSKTSYSITTTQKNRSVLSSFAGYTVTHTPANGEVAVVPWTEDVVVYSYGTVSYNYKRGSNQVVSSTTYNKDEKGRIRQIEEPKNTITFTYDAQHLLKINDSNGLQASYEYTDPLVPHSPTVISDALGQRWETSYNKYGQPLSMTPPAGSVQSKTLLSYYEDPASPYYGYLLKSQTGVGGRSIDYTSYDAQGNLLSWFDGKKMQQSYDALHRVTGTTHADGSKALFGYKGTQLEKTTDELNRTMSYEWCPGCGGIKSLTAPLHYVSASSLLDKRCYVNFI